jgi:hypothetical protein
MYFKTYPTITQSGDVPTFADTIESTQPQSSGKPRLFINPRDNNGRFYPLPTSAIHKVYMYKIAKDTTFNEIVHFLYGFNYYSLVYEPVYGYAVVVIYLVYLHYYLIFTQGFHHGREAEEAIDYINGRTLHGGQMQAYWHGFP